MNLNFNINYDTIFGEELVLNIIHHGKNHDKDSVSQYRMGTIDGHHWNYQMNAQKECDSIDYFYSIDNSGTEKRHEWTTIPHRLELNARKANTYHIYDKWIALPEDSYLYSSAFTDCINRRSLTTLKESQASKVVRLVVRAPQLKSNQRLVVTGADDVLGAWAIDKGLKMTEHNNNEWVVDINADSLSGNKIEFKFAAIDANNKKDAIWETCMNRTVEVAHLADGDISVYDLDQAFFPICNTKVAGTLVPVFSLRSKSSFGIGDFGDLKKMIDFVSQTGQRVLQILPINDTTITHTWTDSYPYSCISIFAIHPQYVDLNQLPAIADKAEAKKYEALRIKLNALSQIDYETVNNAKTEYLKIIFEQESKRIMASAEYKAFFEESQSWLVPYGHYCMLRDKNGTADFTKWEGNETWNEDDREKLTNPRTALYKEVAFYYFVQFILSSQMKAAHDYARSKHVILKGDIPIGVNRYSCDVWMEPKYFNLNSQAGAPPDDFSVNGQNWGFPTYNWDEMLKDDCIWWVRRFQNMSKFFDAYRIDHVLGFFRIWDIPIDSVHGLLGQFSPSLAMSREEIEAYGLRFQEDHFTRPFITDWILDRIFHERAEEVRRRYLVHAHDDVYNLKPEYDTQRKIEAAFEAEHQAMVANKADQAALQAHNNLRDGLYALVSNVLFIRDRKDANKFHPRISAQLDFTYEALYDCDKAVFNRLYNDYYYHRNNQFWYREAMKKLPKLVQATRMLVCAEDLGMVPDCVPWVMDELKILSLELQSMPKDPTVRFGHLSRNPYRSVCTISSHDMPTLRQWWDENIERTQSYYNTMLYRSGGAPHPLPGWLARDIIYRHLASPSMLCVLSIQDWLAISERLRLADQNAERINIPANPKHYWRYRMHLNIEDLISDQEFTGEISGMIEESGRRQ